MVVLNKKDYRPLLACACSAASVMSTLCDPMDCSLPSSFVHGILQEKILERVAKDRKENENCLSGFVDFCKSISEHLSPSFLSQKKPLVNVKLF